MQYLQRAAFAAVMSGALASCASVPGGGTPSNITSSIAQIQQIAVAACGFLPTASTVAGILAAGNPAIATGSAIAQAICAAVVPVKGAKLGSTRPSVSGVAVHGKFVR